MKRRSRRNSSGVQPVQPSTSKAAMVAPWALLGTGASALGWAAIRLSERAKLAELLANTVRIQTLRKEYQAVGKAPAEFQWILDGSWEDRAAAALPIFSMLSAADAYTAIKASLPKVLSPQAGFTLDSIQQKLQGGGATNQPRP
jgi:hypothetical protein